MILIQSISPDSSTLQVTKWLNKYKYDFIRIDDKVFVKSIGYINNAFIVELTNGIKIDTNNVKSYWYRRGEFSLQFTKKISNIKSFDKEFNNYAYKEEKSLFELFVYFLKNNIYSIGDSYSCVYVNKNINLFKAEKNGLNIPRFIVTSKKDELEKFKQKHKNIITKSLNESFSYINKEKVYPVFTEKIDIDTIKQIPDTFQTTLFQEEIQKKFEIRTFYVKGKFYSMAIFSQHDNQTKVDFRKYNDDIPNRNMPFKLPKYIELKLEQLMNDLQYESGSIDLIYSTDNQFYFLEINPIGQFGMVSYPCNYYLEREIARMLINQQSNEN